MPFLCRAFYCRAMQEQPGHGLEFLMQGQLRLIQPAQHGSEIQMMKPMGQLLGV